MAHLNPGGASTSPFSDRASSMRPVDHPLDLARLRHSVAARRRRLLDLEVAMVAACEADAAHARAHGVRMDDRETWDRATWTRYLDAAARHEPEFGPPMRRLLQEIDQLERLMALPFSTGTLA
jgi:hypothetical protein